MNIYRPKFLCTEIYNCINDLRPPYIKNIFCLTEGERPVRNQQQNNLIIQETNRTNLV